MIEQIKKNKWWSTFAGLASLATIYSIAATYGFVFVPASDAQVQNLEDKFKQLKQENIALNLDQLYMKHDYFRYLNQVAEANNNPALAGEYQNRMIEIQRMIELKRRELHARR